MATLEKNAQIITKSTNNDTLLVFPITKIENVNGLENIITPTTFTITPSTTYNMSITQFDTRKTNGIAWFSLTCKSTSAINASSSIVIGEVSSGARKKGNSLVVFNASADGMISNRVISWMSAGVNQQYIRLMSEQQIPANTSIYITGTYLY